MEKLCIVYFVKTDFNILSPNFPLSNIFHNSVGLAEKRNYEGIPSEFLFSANPTEFSTPFSEFRPHHLVVCDFGFMIILQEVLCFN